MAPAEDAKTEEDIGEDLFFGIARVEKLKARALRAIAPILCGSFKFKQTTIFVPFILENSDSEIKPNSLQIATTLCLFEYSQSVFGTY